MLLYLIRHGEPDYTTDTLTEEGWNQARLVADRLVVSGIDEIHASPMGRARQTAAPTAEKLGLPIIIEPWAYELGKDCETLFDDGKRKTISSIPAAYLHRPEFRKLSSREGIAQIEGLRETAFAARFEMLVRNFDALLEKEGYRRNVDGLYDVVRPSDRHVALFCHMGMSRVLMAHAMNLPYHLLAASLMGNFTAITILEFKSEGTVTSPVMLSFADTGHLFGRGGSRPIHYTVKKPY